DASVPGKADAAESVPLVLTEDLTRGIRELARRSHTTPFSVLLSAHFATLYRLTGDRDIVVGSPTANRDADQRDAVGHFVSLLPLRAGLSGDRSFGDVLAAVHDTVLAGLQHPTSDEQLNTLIRKDQGDNLASRIGTVLVLQNFRFPSPT